MSLIHPTAVIDPRADLDGSVTVGPYSVIGPDVRICARTRVGPHCVIEGHTTIGVDNHIFQFSSLGAIPQDKKYAGEPCELVIGNRNTIREFCTFNIGSPGDVGVTRLVMTTGSWPMFTSHMTVRWVTTRSLPTTRNWQDTCTWVIGLSWVGSRSCISLCVLAPMG